MYIGLFSLSSFVFYLSSSPRSCAFQGLLGKETDDWEGPWNTWCPTWKKIEEALDLLFFKMAFGDLSRLSVICHTGLSINYVINWG